MYLYNLFRWAGRVSLSILGKAAKQHKHVIESKLNYTFGNSNDVCPIYVEANTKPYTMNL